MSQILTTDEIAGPEEILFSLGGLEAYHIHLTTNDRLWLFFAGISGAIAIIGLCVNARDYYAEQREEIA